MKTFTKLFLLLAFAGLLIHPAFKTEAATITSGAVVINNPVTLNVYPNPSQGITNFKISTTPGTAPANFRIRISNTIGKVVKTIEAKDFQDGQEISLDLSNMPAGIYFYSLIINERTVETKRLILQM